MKDRLRAITDEPPSMFINDKDEAAVLSDEEVEYAIFDDDVALRAPSSPAFGPMVWRPTTVCVAGTYIAGYTEETRYILGAFAKMSEPERVSLLDLLLKSFTHDPTKRFKAEEIVAHPWFFFFLVADSI